MLTTAVLEKDTRLSGAIAAFKAEGRDVVFSYHKQAPEGVQEVALTATNLDELDADIEGADRSKINMLAVEVSVDGASYARAEVSGPRGHIARHDWELA